MIIDVLAIKKNYHQVGFGVEYLNCGWELHANGYVPLETNQRTFFSSTTNFCNPAFQSFSQHRILIGGSFATTLQRKEFALYGLDTEVGMHLKQTKYFDLYAGIGPYFFSSRSHDSFVGGAFRLVARVSDYFSVGFQSSYDRRFHGTAQGFVSFNIPFGKNISAPSCCISPICERLVQPVRRQEIIVLDQHQDNLTSIPVGSNIANNPATASPYNVLFVNNTNVNPGDGTIENPFNTLGAAELASSVNDIIYVFQGDGTTTGMMQGIVLKNNQFLFGSGNIHDLLTQCGITTIPQMTPKMPIITNTTGKDGGVGIELANRDTVDGIHVDGTLSWAIHGLGINNVLIEHNTISNPQNAGGIGIFDSTGNFGINNNIITGGMSSIFGFDGIHYETTVGTSTVTINNNGPIDNYREAIAVFADAGSVITSSINNNNTTNSGYAGIDVDAFDTGKQTTTITGNTDSNSLGNGIIVFAGATTVAPPVSGHVTATVLNNTVSSSAFEGIIGATGNGGSLIANISGNILINDGITGGTKGLGVETSSTPDPNPDFICLRLNSNNSNTDFSLTNFKVGDIFQLEPPTGNTGTINFNGPGAFTPVPPGSCQ